VSIEASKIAPLDADMQIKTSERVERTKSQASSAAVEPTTIKATTRPRSNDEASVKDDAFTDRQD
jgi:hypothetical protein